MISASAQPKSVLMITIGMAGRASLIFSTVSAMSMLFPVETKTAILNVACCASKIASSPLLTEIMLHPVSSRHCRISSHESADTSRTLSPFKRTAEFIDSPAPAGLNRLRHSQSQSRKSRARQSESQNRSFATIDRLSGSARKPHNRSRYAVRRLICRQA